MKRRANYVLWCSLLAGRLSLAGADSGAPAPVAAPDYLDPTLLTGTIYSQTGGTNTPLFTFRRTATRSGTTVSVLREYFHPDGTTAAVEHVRYEAGALVSFDLEQPESGSSGSVSVKSDPGKPQRRILEFSYAETRNGPKESGRETMQGEPLVNDMIGPFLAAHWNELAGGSPVRFRFAAISRAETVGFRFVKEKDALWNGQPVTILRMEPTSWIIARLVEPLHFTVETAGRHRVLQYSGRTTPRVQVNGKWADLDAVTVFDWKPAETPATP